MNMVPFGDSLVLNPQLQRFSIGSDFRTDSEVVSSPENITTPIVGATPMTSAPNTTALEEDCGMSLGAAEINPVLGMYPSSPVVGNFSFF